jgi:Peptidase S8 pro-domain
MRTTYIHMSLKNVSFLLIVYAIFSSFFFSFQIGSLKGYYLFHHKHVVKRSVNRNELHHNALSSEPEVSVVQA